MWELLLLLIPSVRILFVMIMFNTTVCPLIIKYRDFGEGLLGRRQCVSTSLNMPNTDQCKGFAWGKFERGLIFLLRSYAN